MEVLEYLGPTGDKDPLGLHQADFERSKLLWLIEKAQNPDKAWGPPYKKGIAATVAMMRKMIEDHDAKWEPIRAREKELLAAAGVSEADLSCPRCARNAKLGARFCAGCGRALANENAGQ